LLPLGIWQQTNILINQFRLCTCATLLCGSLLGPSSSWALEVITLSGIELWWRNCSPWSRNRWCSDCRMTSCSRYLKPRIQFLCWRRKRSDRIVLCFLTSTWF
jgi:hypothetical protein